ncbi:MAG: phosphoribosylformylglycinamidine synthase II, partial [Acidobacteriota bacterium]|nr:phosphoribosylformylglycinamidine synthase II [Acidobacteriota bacterium]
SAHDLSDGGLAVTLAECCTETTGAKITAPTDLFTLFGEAPSRILLTTPNSDEVLAIAMAHDVECPLVGVTIGGRLQIGYDHRLMIDIRTSELRLSSDNALPLLIQKHA